MPSVYAHRSCGDLTAAALTGKIRETVDTYRDFYDLGTHGPDPLFFFGPFYENRVNRYGHAIHEAPAAAFLKPAAEAVLAIPSWKQDRDQMLAYLYGFICHFNLDAACHNYIEKAIHVSGFTHQQIESEFEKYLILKEKHSYSAHSYVGHLTYSRAYARVLAPLYPELSEDDLRACFASFRVCSAFLGSDTPHAVHRAFYRVLKPLGKERGIGSMSVSGPLIEGCVPIDRRLTAIRDRSVPEAVRLIENFAAYVEALEKKGPAALDGRFQETFVFTPDWEKVEF